MQPKDLLAGLYRRLFQRPMRQVDRPLIVWMVPLIGPANAKDWGRACRLLDETLASVRAASYDNWAVVVCCQQRPPALPDDPRIHFLQVPDLALAKGISDHSEKVRRMTDHVARTFRGPAYVSHLDADDLMHPDLPGWIARDNNGRGYIVTQGYMADWRTGRLAPLGQGQGQPFWMQCGSCGYFAVDLGRQRWPGLYLRLIGKGHKNYIRRAARLGRPLDPVPFPAMIYMVNHGDNVQVRKGHDKLATVERLAMTDPVAEAQVLQAFGLRKEEEPAGGGRLEVIRR
ncbi:MAG: hypothetical protein H5U17_09805 [Defluviimonas sp.]|nr:hypothetical protein [Defluviimonas sp.]